MSEQIKIIPTWAAVADILILALENGTPIGKQAAREELKRMAQLLDEINNNGLGTTPEIEGFPTQLKSHWDDDPEWPSQDWQLEVANNDTRLGYLDWVSVRAIEAEMEASTDDRT